MQKKEHYPLVKQYCKAVPISEVVLKVICKFQGQPVSVSFTPISVPFIIDDCGVNG